MSTVTAARDSFRVFGTTAVVLVGLPQLRQQARTLIDGELAAVDLACSRFRPDSELSALNASDGAWTPVSGLFAQLLGAALRAARLTGGDVDPTCGRALADLGYDRDFAEVRQAGEIGARQTSVRQTETWHTGARQTETRETGARQTETRETETWQTGTRQTGVRHTGRVRPVAGWRNVQLDQPRLRARLRRGAQLDLGATAKAWAADRCADRAAANLGCGVLVSLGGDIAVAGQPPDGGWRVRVTDDHAAGPDPAGPDTAGPDAAGQTVAIQSGGLATSSTTVRTWIAGGRRVHHIIDPATGEPARSCWRTVSVAAGSCLDANTASTAAIVRGAAALRWLQDTGLPARLVRADGSVETTAGWPGDQWPGNNGPGDQWPGDSGPTGTA